MTFGIWPTSVSLGILFRARAVQDTGPVTTMSAAFPGCDLADLTIVLPNPGAYPVTNDSIIDAVCTQVMNSNLSTIWSPPNGLTILESLRMELSEALAIPILSGSARSLRCVFNGQFGPLQLALA